MVTGRKRDKSRRGKGTEGQRDEAGDGIALKQKNRTAEPCPILSGVTEERNREENLSPALPTREGEGGGGDRVWKGIWKGYKEDMGRI